MCWKDGSGQEWVENQLSELLDHAGVEVYFFDIWFVGKQLTFAEHELVSKNVFSHSTFSSRSAELIVTLALFNFWLTTEKTRAHRKVAIALRNQILSEQCILNVA